MRGLAWMGCCVMVFAAIGCEPRSRPSEQPVSEGVTEPVAAPQPTAVDAGQEGSDAVSEARTADASDGAPPDAAGDAAGDADAAPAAPELFGPDGGALGQTEDRPSTESPFFQYRAKELFQAIVEDDPSLAEPFFFPKVAYEQVKDIAKPGRDWEWRLIGQLKRNLHDYHKQLGRHRGEARFLRLEVPENRAKWMKPGSEGNRVGYWRVLHSRLVYLDHEDRERSLDVTSFISWRGEWYLVHLHGFK